MTTGSPRATGRPAARGAAGRPGGEGPRAHHTGPRASAIGFILMTALVAVTATGVFILLDPRAQAFWGAKLGEIAAAAQDALRR